MRDPERLSLFVSTYSIHKSFFPFAVHITFGILFDLFSFKKSSIEEGQDEKNEGSRKRRRCGGKLCARGHPFFPAVLFRRYSEDRNAGTVMVTSNAVRQYMASWLTQYNREFSWSPEPRVLLPPLLSFSFFLSLPSFCSLSPFRNGERVSLTSSSSHCRSARRVRVHAIYVAET